MSDTGASNVLSYEDAAARQRVQIDETPQRVRIYCPANTWRTNVLPLIVCSVLVVGQGFVAYKYFASYAGWDRFGLASQRRDLVWGAVFLANVFVSPLMYLASTRRWVAIEMTDAYLVETVGRLWRGATGRRWSLAEISRISSDKRGTGIYLQLRREEAGIFPQLGAEVNWHIAAVLQRRLQAVRDRLTSTEAAG